MLTIGITSPAAFTSSSSSPISARTPKARSARSLGTQLERDRLQQRAARVKLVIGALRERANARNGETPRPLQAAIEGFGRELADLERQLRRSGRR